METQNEWVLGQLQKGRRLTPKEAMDERGIMRLGARIYELRNNNYPNIRTDIIPMYNRYGQVCYVAEYYFGGVGF